jgi:Fur family ferric uptake transcriptional regulator
VLEILEQSSGHLDAEQVFERARKRDPRIGIATVYRTLALLKEMGLVDEHLFGEDHGHFETKQTGAPHFHFTCLKCGKVIEFQSNQVMKLARQLCEKESLQVVEIHLHFRGYCDRCLPSEQGC